MDITKEAQESINQLQLIEQNVHTIALQKQQLQSELFELESALRELETTNSAYKIIGNIMVASKKDELKKDLTQKKEIVDLRMKNLDKHERDLKEKEKKLREKVLGSLKNE